MREIKFRAWIPQDKRMFQVGNLVIPKGLNELGDQELGVAETYSIIKPHHYIQPVLMQFTGLLDKPGKEIYEGDIVKLWNPDMKLVTEVGWDLKYHGWYFYHEGQRTANAYTGVSEFPLEVIGNIYESPHLLDNNSKSRNP